jgi:hypothetical protein
LSLPQHVKGRLSVELEMLEKRLRTQHEHG